jgi:hypothetical protein
MQSPYRSTGALAFAALLLYATSGCGGGGGGGTGGTGGGTAAEQTLTFGSLITRVSGTVQAPITIGSAGGILITAAAGGLVSSLAINDANPTLAETSILLNRTGNLVLTDPLGVYTTSFNNLTGNFPSPVAWSPDGTKVAYANGGIWTAKIDGTSPTSLVTSPAGFLDGGPTWVSNTQIAFTRFSVALNRSQVFRVNADGNGLINLSNNTTSDDFRPSESLLLGEIVFTRRASGATKLFTMKNDGTGQAAVPGSASGDDFAAASPVSTLVAFANGGKIVRQLITGGLRLQISAPPATAVDTYPAYAPDGSGIAFERDDAAKGVAQVWVMSDQGLLPHDVSNTGWNDFSPSWSPFFAKRNLIGTGGLLGTAAAGFLVGRSGEVIESVVTFDAATRNGATITPQTPPGTTASTVGITTLPNVVWTLAADKITALGYVNGVEAPVQIVVNSVPATNGAVVDMNAVTGRVTDIVPYKADKAVGKGTPTVTVENGAQVVRGQLLGVWDAAGVNHAPNGAVELRLNGKTGAILSVR